MKTRIRNTLAVAMTLVAGSATAQSSTANEQRCQQLAAEVQQQFQAAVQARVPKEDPSSFNQNGYDIKGIMSQDVTAGLGKLMSLDFSGIINKIVQQGMAQAQAKATSAFSTKMNDVLKGVGVPGVSFSGTQLTVNNQQIVGGLVNGAMNSVAPSTSGIAADVKGVVTGAVTRGVTQNVGPYGATPKKQ